MDGITGPSMGNLSSGMGDLMGINDQGIGMQSQMNAQGVQQIMETEMLEAIRKWAENIAKVCKASLDAIKGLIG